MNTIDFRDFYIKYKGHPNYVSSEIIEDDVVNVIIQKYEMILFTNKGEVLGEPDLGCDLLMLLNEKKVASNYVESVIRRQISKYIPELDSMNYSLSVAFTEDVQNYQDIMYIYFQLADYEVFAQISNTTT